MTLFEVAVCCSCFRESCRPCATFQTVCLTLPHLLLTIRGSLMSSRHFMSAQMHEVLEAGLADSSS